MQEDPINKLYNNIMKFFETTNPHSEIQLKKYVQDGKLNPEIIIEEGSELIKFPFVNLDTNQITIQSTYLSHLWAFIYSIFVIYEEAIQKKLLDKTFTGQIDLDSDLLKRANLLLTWSMSLKTTYSDWDRILPNPDIDYSKQNPETFYIEKINNLFQSSVSFLLYHEVAHVVNGHKSYYLGFDKLNNYDDIKELEKEADDFAFNALIYDDDDEKNKIEKGLSIMIVFCSAFMLSSRHTLSQKKHPDIDQRLLTIINKLNFEKIENEFYIYYLGSYILQMYLQKEGQPILCGIYDNHKELFYKYLEQIDYIKQL